MDATNGTRQTDPWYSNKEIFEMVQGLRGEMQETRRVIHEYNQLRRDLTWAIENINRMQSEQEARSTTIMAIREWGGWIVAVAVLLLQLWE